jgi:hypothetical protein
MVIYNKSKFLKSKRFILPFIHSKDLKPLSSLLIPSNFIIPMLIVAILGQLSEDLKTTLNPKDIQQIPSVKLYFKLLSSGKSTVSLSVLYALSKTLGPELETLSVLNIRERINFLSLLHKKIILEKSPARILSKPHILSDHVELMKHRKGLALQLRNLLIATPIFSTHSLVLGLSIGQITIDCIINSCKCYWNLLGLNDEEFDFSLKKEAINCIKKYSLEDVFEVPKSLTEAVKILLYVELKDVTYFNNKLVFYDDLVVLQGKNNLTIIEDELTFIERKIPNLPQDIFIPDSNLKDLIIRAAIDQRKEQRLKIDNIFKKTEKKKLKGKLNINILKNISIKKTLYND